MGRDRGLAVEKMMEIHFLKTNILVVARPKVPVLHGAEIRQITTIIVLLFHCEFFFEMYVHN